MKHFAMLILALAVCFCFCGCGGGGGGDGDSQTADDDTIDDSDDDSQDDDTGDDDSQDDDSQDDDTGDDDSQDDDSQDDDTDDDDTGDDDSTECDPVAFDVCLLAANDVFVWECLPACPHPVPICKGFYCYLACNIFLLEDLRTCFEVNHCDVPSEISDNIICCGLGFGCLEPLVECDEPQYDECYAEWNECLTHIPYP